MKTIAPTQALLPQILALHGRWKAGCRAIVCGDQSLNWNEFNRRLNQVANGLQALGLEKVDRVGVVMGNGLAMGQALFGIMKGGSFAFPSTFRCPTQPFRTCSLIRAPGH